MVKKTKSHKITKGKLQAPLDIRSKKDIPAFEHMLSSGPMVIVLVYADWCGHCTTYKNNVWTPLKSTPNKMANMASVHYDQLDNTSLRGSKISGYPTVMVVGNDKKPATFNDESGIPTNAIPNANDLNTMRQLVKTPAKSSVSTLRNTPVNTNYSATPSNTNYSATPRNTNYSATPRRRNLPDMDAPVPTQYMTPPDISLNTELKNSSYEPYNTDRPTSEDMQFVQQPSIEETQQQQPFEEETQQQPFEEEEQPPFEEDVPISMDTIPMNSEDRSIDSRPMTRQPMNSTPMNTQPMTRQQIDTQPMTSTPMTSTPEQMNTRRNLNTPPTNEPPLVDATLPYSETEPRAARTSGLNFNTPRRDITTPSNLGIDVIETPVSQNRRNSMKDKTQGATPILEGGSLYRKLHSIKKRKSRRVRKTKKIVKRK